MWSFIANLSKRIKIRSESKTGANKQLNEKELYHKTFPYFIWLLRDSLLEIPDDYEDLTDFLLKEVSKKFLLDTLFCSSSYSESMWSRNKESIMLFWLKSCF